MAFSRLCCSVSAHIAASADCANPVGGIQDLRVACIGNIAFTEVGCAGGDYDVTGGGGPITVTIPANDARITGITAVGGSATPFYTIETKDKTAEHVFSITYDEDTNKKQYDESINFDVNVKDRSFYCVIESYIGQEVFAVFQEKGTDRWYGAGRDGGLTFTSITGGSGVTDFTPTSFVIAAVDQESIFRQIVILIEDPANAGTTIDDTTAQLDALTAP